MTTVKKTLFFCLQNGRNPSFRRSFYHPSIFLLKNTCVFCLLLLDFFLSFNIFFFFAHAHFSRKKTNELYCSDLLHNISTLFFRSHRNTIIRYTSSFSMQHSEEEIVFKNPDTDNNQDPNNGYFGYLSKMMLKDTFSHLLSPLQNHHGFFFAVSTRKLYILRCIGCTPIFCIYTYYFLDMKNLISS